MKTVTKIALMGLATVVFTAGSVFANDPEWIAIDNHHGSVTYVRRWEPLHTVTTTTTSVAFAGHRQDARLHQHERAGKSREGEFRSVTVPQAGEVRYYAPED